MVTTVTVTVWCTSLEEKVERVERAQKFLSLLRPCLHGGQLQSPVISSITQIAAYEEYGSGCHFTDDINKWMIGMEIGLF